MQRLTSIGLSSFKPFKKSQGVRLAPITLIYGPNSGGKSSLLQALLLLKQTMLSEEGRSGYLLPCGSLADLGNFTSLISDHDVKRSLKFSLSYDSLFQNPESIDIGTSVSLEKNLIELNYKATPTGISGKTLLGELSEVLFRFQGRDKEPELSLEMVRLSSKPDSQGRTLEDPSPVFRWKNPDKDSVNLLNWLQSAAGFQPDEKQSLRQDPRERLRDQIESIKSSLDSLKENEKALEQHFEVLMKQTQEESSHAEKNLAIRTKFIEKKTLEMKEKIENLSKLEERNKNLRNDDLIPIIKREREQIEQLDRELEETKYDICRLKDIRERTKEGFKRVEVEADRLLSRRRMEEISLLTELEERRKALQRYDEDFMELNPLLASARLHLWQGLPAKIVSEKTGEPLALMGREERLRDIFLSFQRLLSSISYLGPLRRPPSRYYVGYGEQRGSVGSQGEFTPQLLFSSPQSIREKINHWFSQFEIPYTVHIRKLGSESIGDVIALALQDRRAGEVVELSSSDVGFGIGQLLPIVVEGVVSEKRILCVEQPEIHLHPRLQAHLADFFIKTSIGCNKERKSFGKSSNQWLIETHSEALMLRLQRRIRERELSANDVSVIYVDPPKGEEGTRLLELRLDEEGNFLDEWPAGFFEESYDEIFN